jgi:hypothetical protein
VVGWILAGIVSVSVAVGLCAIGATVFLRNLPTEIAESQSDRWRPVIRLLGIGSLGGMAVSAAVGWAVFGGLNLTLPTPTSSVAESGGPGAGSVKLLSCTLVAPVGQAAMSQGRTPQISFSFDPTNTCVNGRTSYRRTTTGYERYVVVGTRSSTIRNTISGDFSSFEQDEFPLSLGDYARWSAAAKSVGSCSGSTNGLERLGALGANLSSSPTATKRWTCHVETQ